MTKTLPYLELEENNFNASTSSENSNFISNSTEMFIDSKIIREEEKLMTENEEIEMIEKYEALVETHANELTEYAMTEEDLMKEREAEIKERRYKKLMHLLNSSKMYSTILKDRLKSEKKEK